LPQGVEMWTWPVFVLHIYIYIYMDMGFEFLFLTHPHKFPECSDLFIWKKKMAANGRWIL